MDGKIQASRLAEIIFHMHLAIWGQSCFLVHLASCIPPAPQQSLWGWQHLLDGSFGKVHSYLRPEINDGCDISYLLIWQETFHFVSACHRDGLKIRAVSALSPAESPSQTLAVIVLFHRSLSYSAKSQEEGNSFRVT